MCVFLRWTVWNYDPCRDELYFLFFVHHALAIATPLVEANWLSCAGLLFPKHCGCTGFLLTEQY